MTAIKITTVLDGVPELLRAIQLANVETRERTRAAIRRGTQRVAAGARARAPKVTGELASTIRDEYSKDGMIGFIKVGIGKLARRSHSSSAARQNRLAKTRKAATTRAGKGTYAPVVERGDPRRRIKPHPFLLPELMEDKPGILEDLRQAMIAGPRSAGLGE